MSLKMLRKTTVNSIREFRFFVSKLRSLERALSELRRILPRRECRYL